MKNIVSSKCWPHAQWRRKRIYSLIIKVVIHWTLTLFRLAQRVQWIFEISTCDVMTADYKIIMSRTLKVTGYHVIHVWPQSIISKSKAPGKRGHIVAHDVSWARKRVGNTKWMLLFHAVQTGKHLLRTQNVSEQNQKHFLCPGHKCTSRGQTGKHLCPQQCVLVCQGLNHVEFARFVLFAVMSVKKQKHDFQVFAFNV